MKDQILKIAKVKDEKSFYKKFPTEEAFMAKHGKALKKAAMGSKMVQTQLKQLTDFGNPPIAQDGGNWANYGVPGLSTATFDKSSGLINNASGSVSKADTQALGFGKKAPGAGGGAGGEAMAGLNAIPAIIGGIEAIGQQKTNIKKADQSSQLSGLAAQAANTREKVERKYVRPEDALVQPGQLGNPYGSGTNYLAAQNGTMIGGNPTEIQNTYNPGDIYTDGGYEPIESKNIKQYQKGGKLISRDKINIDSYGNQGTAFRDIFQNPNMTQDTTYAYDSPTAMLRYNTNRGNPNAYVGGRGGFTSAQPDSLAKYKQLLSSPFNSDDSGNMKRLVSGKYEYGGDLPKAEFGEYFQDSGQAQIGGAAGEAIGTMLGGPLGGMAGKLIGQVGGNLLGGVKDARKLKKYQDETAMNTQQAAWQNQLQSGQFSKSMEHGGYMNPEYNPQVIAKFGDYSVKDLLKPPYDADMLRSGGHLAQVGYTAPSAEAMFTGRPDMPQAQFGLVMGILNKGMIDTIQNSEKANKLKSAVGSGMMNYGGQLAMGGELEVGEGGRLETLSYNPNLPGGEIGMFRGASHDNGGIKTKYGENEVEVEGGEPAVKLQDGGSSDNLVVFGNIKINKEIADLMGDPKAKGKKFKTYIADIAKNDAKQLKTIQKGLDLVEEYDGNSSYDKLGMNSGMANLMGAKAQQKINAEKIKEASIVQDAIHQTARQLGAKSDRLAEGKIEKETDPSMVAKNGKKAQKGIISETGMDYSDVDFDYTLPQALVTSSRRKANPFAQSSNVTGVDIFNKYTGPQDDYSSIDNTDNPSFGSKLLGATKAAGKFLGKGIDKYGPTLLSNLAPFLRPSNANEDLPPDQLYPEYFALATNQLDPVQAQTYQPMLDTPYDISLNDQINAVDSQARAAIRAAGSNPAAQAQIMSQALEAKNKVLGEQSRINQTNKMQTYSKNRDLLNDAQLKNLQILDQQYVRQAQAKSNTKEQAFSALSSIAAKTSQQRALNKKLAILENTYNYRFTPSGRAINMNAPAQFNMSGNMNQAGSFRTDASGNQMYPIYNPKTGKIKGYSVAESGGPSADEIDDVFNKNGGKTSKTKARNSSIVKALKNL